MSFRGVVVEGKNSYVALTDCDVTGSMSNTYNGDSDENIHCIMIYQSMSGDADVGGRPSLQKGRQHYGEQEIYSILPIRIVRLRSRTSHLHLPMMYSFAWRATLPPGWGTEGAKGGGDTD